MADYLFLSHTLETGGIESLLVRMANALVEGGKRVSVRAPDGPMRRHLSAGVDYADSTGRALGSGFCPPERGTEVRIWGSLPSMLSEGWSLQKRLWAQWGAPSRMVAGIFHPEQWYHRGKWSASWIKGRLLQGLIEPGSLYFMNDATLLAHVDRWGPHLRRCPVFRLHLGGGAELRWRPTGGAKLRICSVGRVVPFKTYNADALDLLQELAADGIEAEWDIFGDGPDRAMLEARAKAAQAPLRFRGELAYDQLASTIAAYDLFVGMGTAALEAAQIGMPIALALSDVPRGTYGFLFEAPGDSVAEVVAGHPPRDLLSTLRQFAKAGAAERMAIGAACARSARERSGGERAPFDAMFADGRPCPAPLAVQARAELLQALQGRAGRHDG